MSEKNEAVAESIINTEGSALYHAGWHGGGDEYLQTKEALKARIIRELELAEGRGAAPNLLAAVIEAEEFLDSVWLSDAREQGEALRKRFAEARAKAEGRS